MNTAQRNAGLPIKRTLTPTYILSFIIAILMAAASIVGILFRTTIYPTDELLNSTISTDVVSLFLGLPILLGSMWLAWRGKLLGLLFWPGALFYVLYDSIARIFAMPPNVAFLLHLTVDQRYNRKLWIARIRQVAYPWGNHTPKTARSRRKDTPCTSLPQMMSQEKCQKSRSHWMNWPGKEHVG